MNITKSLIIAISFLTITASHAQKRMDWDGVRVAYTACEFNGNSLMNDMTGVSVGYSSLTRLSRKIPIGVETGIYGDWVGQSKNGAKTTLIDLSVPVNLGYKMNLTNDIALFPYFGANFKAYIIAKTSYDKSDKKINYFNNDDTNGYAYERWHVGWHIGADLQLSRFVIGVNYGEDLTRFSPRTDKKMNTFQVRAGVNL